MTNSEIIDVLDDITWNGCGRYEKEVMIKCRSTAISALEENDKLKAEIEQLKSELKCESAENKWNQDKANKLWVDNKQLKSELEQSIKLPLTNADKIRSMSDEELAEFLSENTNCDCCNIQCVDKLNCPSMSSCLFRFMEWLKSEVSE